MICTTTLLIVRETLMLYISNDIFILSYNFHLITSCRSKSIFLICFNIEQNTILRTVFSSSDRSQLLFRNLSPSCFRYGISIQDLIVKCDRDLEELGIANLSGAAML